MYSFKVANGPNGSPGPTSVLSSSHERDIRKRRAQGEAACAECRRLRLKCDRMLPCSSCARRGCPSICPNGTLTTGHGSRFVSVPNSHILANTEKLHDKLERMSDRIRQLEDALRIVQAVISSSPHPLLSEELLAVKNVLDIPEDPEVNDPVIGVESEVDVFSEFGTLSISDQGETRFYGRSGAAAFMANTTEDPVYDKILAIRAKLPTEIVYFNDTFPFPPVHMPKDRIRQLIESRLPSYERATALGEAYIQHISMYFRPVDREQIMEELIPAFYKKRGQTKDEKDAGLTVHRLALLIAVFACGAMADLTQDSCNEEGELYRQLSRTALSLQSIFEGTSLATVQAVALLGLYEFFSCSTSTLDSASKMQSLSFFLATSIGLHWDPASWGIDMKYVNRRRSLFWELCKLDSLKSLGSGRPATFRMHEMDCRFPEEVWMNSGLHAAPTPNVWLYKFVKEIAAPVAAKLCSVNAMKYTEILDWDRTIRKFIPPKTDISVASSEHSPNSETPAESLLFAIYKETILLYVHRNFFVRALRENPTNPTQSRFAPSFLSTYSSAIAVLKLTQRECDGEHSFLMCQWPMWVNVVSSGVVVGLVAANNSPKELARSARTVLDLAISLFEKGPVLHPVVRNGLSIILRLRERSRTFVREDTCRKSSAAESTEAVKVEEVEEALSAIGGENRVVKKPLHLKLQERYPPPTSANDTPLKQYWMPSPTKPSDGISLVSTCENVLPLSSNMGVGDVSLQYLETLIPSQMHDPTTHANLTNDILNYPHEAPIDSLYQEVFPGSGLGGWDMTSSSWTTMDWSTLEIPENFDFDIDPTTNTLVEGGDDMILDAWNFILEEPRSKYSNNEVNNF